MGRAPCCDKANVKKGPWSPEEDNKLKHYIEKHGTGGNWIALPQKAGLKRCGKSCRLRWLNYLRPNLKHGEFSEEEDKIICSLFSNIGSRWSIIAAQLPGRTDNNIKNYWNTKLKKKLTGVSPYSQRKQIPIHYTQDHSPYPSQFLCSTMFKYYNSNHYYTSPTVSFPGSEAILVPSNYSNATTNCYLAANHMREVVQNQEDVGVYSSMHSQYHPAAKESFSMFGNGGSTCSSSDGSCSRISYGREIKQEDEMGYRQNFIIHNGVVENQDCMLNYGIGSLNVGESSLDYYDPEVIKQLITDTSANDNSRLSSIFSS